MKRIACLVSGACALGALALIASSCGEDGTSLPGTCSLDFDRPVDASFEDGRINALLEATARFNVAATDLESDVLTACNAINTDLGAETAEDVETACNNAQAAIEAELTAAEGTVSVVVDVVPAVCTIDAQATADCVAECDADFDVETTPIMCEGGELSGSCSAMCRGSCTLEGSVACEGSCSGTCSGSCTGTVEATCDGTCTGTCDGTCSSMGSDGQCNGTCEGTCRGECDGTIEGSCSAECSGMCEGSCRADVNGMCEGRCTGECTVEFTEPRCEGGEVNVMADAECAASCEAEASVMAECTDPEVVVTLEGDVTGGDLDALAATLRDNLPPLLAALEKAEVLASASVELGNQVEGAIDAAGSASIEALDCLRQAFTVYGEAAASVEVSVSASASVSGTATGSAGG